MSRQQERDLFRDWPDVAERVRQWKLETGGAHATAGTDRLHENNVARSLRSEHSTRRVLVLGEGAGQDPRLPPVASPLD
jgi:hypothetical protein